MTVAALILAQIASQSQPPVLLMRMAPGQSVGQDALHESEYHQDSGNPQCEQTHCQGVDDKAATVLDGVCSTLSRRLLQQIAMPVFVLP